MKKLVLTMIACLLCLVAQGQRVDFSTFDKVFHQGKVSVVCQYQEYRLIVGSLKNPRMSLLLGSSPELAVGSLNRIMNIAKSQPEAGSANTTSLTVFCGEPFSITISGPLSNREIAFKGMNIKGRFSLNMTNIAAIIQSIEK